MKKFILPILIFILYLSQNNACVAQQLNFFNCNQDHGLYSATIKDITEDDNGFIWLATLNGLSRFDGNKVKTFHHKKGEQSLNSNTISSIVKSVHGNFLWIGTYTGLNKFNIDNEQFTNSFNNKLYNLPVKQSQIFDIHETTNGDLWLAMTNSFVKFSEKRNSYEIFAIDSLFGSVVSRISVDANGLIWIGVQGKGLYFFNEKTKQLKKLDYSSIHERLPQVTDFEFHDNQIYVSTENGIVVIDYTTQQIVKRFFENTKIARFEFENDSILWLAPFYEGLKRLNIRTSEYFSFYKDQCTENSISSNTIMSIHFSDTYQTLWLGTFSNGLDYSIVSYNPFSEFDNFKYPKKLKKIECFGIHETNDNKVIFSTNNEYIYYDLKTNELKTFDLKNIELSTNENYVNYMLDDVHNNWWIGTSKGIVRYQPSNGKAELFSKIEKNSFVIDRTSFLYEESDTSLLVGTYSGLGRMNTITGKVSAICYSNDSVSLKGKIVTNIYADSQKRKWVCTSGAGLYCIENDSITRHYSFYTKNKISSNFVMVVHEDLISKNSTQYDYIWVGLYEGGLNRIDLNNNKIDFFSEKDGMSDNCVYGIIEDKNYQLWLSTDNGITVFKYNGKHSFLKVNKADGLRGNEFFQNSYIKLSTGLFVFGAEKGLVSFYPDSLKNKINNTKIFITDIKILNKAVNLSNCIMENNNINNCAKITLMHEQDDISISFTAINFDKNKKITFQYKLDNYDTEWVNANESRTAAYSNLPAGKYTFRVRLSDDHFIPFAANERSIQIIIKPPFYETTWFIAFTVAVLLIVIFAFVKYRTLHLKRQKQQLERLVDKKTEDIMEVNALLEERNEIVEHQKEELSEQANNLMTSNELLEGQRKELEKYRYHLEELIEERTAELVIAKEKAEESDRLKMAFLANMSHEIRTPLNAIVGFTDLLYDEDLSPRERKNYLDYVSKNSDALLILIEDIIDIAKIEAGQINTEEQQFSLNELMRELYENFKISNTSTEVEIIYTNLTDPNLLIMESDKYRIRQVVNNLVNNALKFTEKGYVKFGFNVEKDKAGEKFVKFQIEDTGIGIPQNKIDRIFQRFYKVEDSKARLFRGTGLGLSISKSIVEYLGGEIWVESESDKGSLFCFTIPLKRLFSIITEKELKRKDIQYDNYKWKGKRILIAEDETTNFEYLRSALIKTNIEVIHAVDGNEVMHLYKTYKPDILLLDIKMPNIGGIDVAIEIRKNDKNVVLIAQTAFAMAEEKLRIMTAGFNDFLSKPIKLTDLLSTLQKYLNK